ncbi:MAG: DUF502 domain-containing protein [Candidatus Hydrothermarchaeales archaeon]
MSDDEHLRKLRNFFITGLAVTVPLTATAYIVWAVFRLLDGILSPFLKLIIGEEKYVSGIGLVITLFLITAVGALTTIAIGKRMVTFFEDILTRIPLVRGIYSTFKEASDAFLVHKPSDGSRGVVLVEYPRKGIYTIGLTTAATVKEIQDKTHEPVVNIFIPTSPNPTSGMLILVPEDSVTPLDMTTEEGLKLIVSGGFSTIKKHK